MTPSPAHSNSPVSFEKHAAHKARAAQPVYRGRQHQNYDDDESRRSNWMLAGVMVGMLAIGVWLVLAGLI